MVICKAIGGFQYYILLSFAEAVGITQRPLLSLLHHNSCGQTDTQSILTLAARVKMMGKMVFLDFLYIIYIDEKNYILQTRYCCSG